jgi:hypothetical protein
MLDFSYIYQMDTMSIEILDPKAKKFLQDLAKKKLIAISKSTPNPFLKVLKKIRAKKAKLTLEEITREVEAVRSKRYAK